VCLMRVSASDVYMVCLLKRVLTTPHVPLAELASHLSTYTTMADKHCATIDTRITSIGCGCFLLSRAESDWHRCKLTPAQHTFMLLHRHLC
jgi:hypothetical protein